MRVTLGRRVKGPEDLEHPGDYCGPFQEVGPDLEPTGRTAVWVMTVAGARRIVSPPWVFRERGDGSLEVQGAGPFRVARVLARVIRRGQPA